MKATETNDNWFRTCGLRMKPEYGLQYLTAVCAGIRRCLDRAGVASLSQSMEDDMA